VISGSAKPLGIFSFKLKSRYELASCSAIENSLGFGGLSAAFFTIASILACRRLPSSRDSATARLLEAHTVKRKIPHRLLLQVFFITTGYDLMKSRTREPTRGDPFRQHWPVKASLANSTGP
jgi:hypothetical protein